MVLLAQRNMSKLEVPFHTCFYIFDKDKSSVRTGPEGLGSCSFLQKDIFLVFTIFLGKILRLLIVFSFSDWRFLL